MMASNQRPPPDETPMAALTIEARQRLEKMDKDIEKSQGDLDAMKELGLDVSKMQEMLDFSKKARKVILKRL